MICDWCNAEVIDLGAHFASYAGKPCRIAALAHQPVIKLDDAMRRGCADAQAERSKIRGRTRRDLFLSRNRDRLEGRAATNVPWTQERQGRT